MKLDYKVDSVMIGYSDSQKAEKIINERESQGYHFLKIVSIESGGCPSVWVITVKEIQD
jgi:phosphopantetheine adenylyltransferase